MFFRDDSCISENTIERYYNDYRIHELMGSDWFGIMSLSKTGHVLIDNRYDVNCVGDSYALEFVKAHAEELQTQDYPYKMFEFEGNYYVVYPIRINEHGYIIFFLYCRLSSSFEEKDLAWYRLFSEVSYKRLLLNNELIQQSNYMSMVLENAQEIITVLDPQGNVISSNKAADRLLSAEKGNMHFSYLEKEAQTRIFQLIDEAIATNTKRSLSNAVSEYDGIKHILDLTISPLSNSKGVPSGVVVMGTDVTTKRMSEYELEQLKHYALLGEISLGLSHDVKNPLMNIRSCITLLKRNESLFQYRELLHTIDGEIKRIDDIVGQMLSFGKVSKQNTFDCVNINEILDNCVQMLYRQKACRRINIRYLPGKPMPPIRAKNSDIQQIFLNVMLNSLQAIEDNGCIDISSFYAPESKRIYVVISDDGCGIPEGDMQKIFSPYFSTKPNSSGLGLFMVKRIVEQYHGSIHIESMKWQETVCTITLPCP